MTWILIVNSLKWTAETLCILILTEVCSIQYSSYNTNYNLFFCCWGTLDHFSDAVPWNMEMEIWVKKCLFSVGPATKSNGCRDEREGGWWRVTVTFSSAPPPSRLPLQKRSPSSSSYLLSSHTLGLGNDVTDDAVPSCPFQLGLIQFSVIYWDNNSYRSYGACTELSSWGLYEI